MKNNNLKILSLGGVLGPLLYTTVVLISAGLRPNYSHVSQFMSDLGATGSPNADFMNYMGFIPSGLMIASFGISLIMLLSNSLTSRIGSVLVTIFGIGMVVVGFFSCDIGCPREGSLENTIHDQISGPIFLSVITGILLLGISFRKHSVLKRLWVYSIITSLLCFGFMAGLINAIESNYLIGIWQRMLLSTIFIWCVVMGLKIFKSNLTEGNA
ncbi:DUF998 domain-containing protein [Arenibacter sp. TNZ]|uniref:DUF998 domain-containing protein n=1 Tax=Arenibacter TaxID=178469 RepID=UPI000CD3AB1A|nr:MULTISPECIES: DUF998 domain-containing protein [Arenibacter]MCM4173068.1 DUF998 domain-containing protein [Arenibacter sp. TNZ]